MSIVDLADAFCDNKVVDADSDGVQDGKFDFVDFDACLMGSVEAILAYGDYMDYYIASPETEPGYGQYYGPCEGQYTGWLDELGKNPTKSAYELGKIIVDDFISFYDKESGDGSSQEGTLAVFDMNRLLTTSIDGDTFVSALTKLKANLATNLQSGKYGLVYYAGTAVSEMVSSGMDKDSIDYAAVKQHWEDTAVDDTVQHYIDAVGGEAEASWLEGLINQMKIEAVQQENVTAQLVETSEGTGSKITLGEVRKQAIESVEMNVIAELPAAKAFVEDPAHADHVRFLGNYDAGVTIGRVNGSQIIDVDPKTDGYKAAVDWLFDPTSTWTLKPPQTKWYALRDAAGNLHATAADEGSSELDIPTGYSTMELKPTDYDDNLNPIAFEEQEVWRKVWLIYKKDGNGEWALDEFAVEQANEGYRLIPASEFRGTYEPYPVMELGRYETVVPISKKPFMLTPETMGNINVEYMEVSDMGEDVADADGDGRVCHSTVTVTNIYGHKIDITDLVNGKQHIKLARIKPGVYSKDSTGELVPELVYQGETLVEGMDYTLEKANDADTFDKVGAYEVEVTGIGRFAYKATMVFNIVAPEDEAAQAVADAEREVAVAQEAVNNLPQSASASEVKDAYEKLVKAQQALAAAQEALNRTKAVLSAEKQAELEDKVAQLEQDVQDLNDKIAQAQVIDISNYAATLEKTSYPYTGKAIEPAVSVSGVSADNYVVTYVNNKNIGTAKVVIEAKGGAYTGTITKTFIITKKANPLNVTGKTAKVKVKKLKKKKQTLKVAKVLKGIKTGKGKLSYAKVSGSKKIVINKKTGKVTVKKRLKKGTYPVKVKVTAAGNKYFESATQVATFKIKVK